MSVTATATATDSAAPPSLATIAPHLHRALVQHQSQQHLAHPKLVSLIADTVSFSSPVSTSVLTDMSHRELLRVHLSDCAALTSALVSALDPAFVSASGSDAATDIVNKLIRKDALMAESVDALIAHQQRQQELADLKREIASLDSSISTFASELCRVESSIQSLLRGSDDTKLRALDGEVRQQRFTVAELLAFAQRLSLVSFAPSDFIERKGLSLAKPPAPQEHEMSRSLLHLDVPALLQYSKERAVREQQAQEAHEFPMPQFEQVAEASAAAAAAAATAANQAQPTEAPKSKPTRPVAPTQAQAAAAAALALDLDMSDDDSDEELT